MSERCGSVERPFTLVISLTLGTGGRHALDSGPHEPIELGTNRMPELNGRGADEQGSVEGRAQANDPQPAGERSGMRDRGGADLSFDQAASD